MADRQAPNGVDLRAHSSSPTALRSAGPYYLLILRFVSLKQLWLCHHKPSNILLAFAVGALSTAFLL
jgi:hypothetical protein